MFLFNGLSQNCAEKIVCPRVVKESMKRCTNVENSDGQGIGKSGSDKNWCLVDIETLGIEIFFGCMNISFFTYKRYEQKNKRFDGYGKNRGLDEDFVNYQHLKCLVGVCRDRMAGFFA